MADEQMQGLNPDSLGTMPGGGEMPPMPGTPPPSIPGQDMSSDERRSDLERKFEEILNKERSLNSKKMMSKNQMKEAKIRLLQQFYEMLKGFGVDPNDLNSISQFMQTLEEENPDLAELLMKLFDDLDPDKDVGMSPAQQGEIPQGMPPTMPQGMPGMPPGMSGGSPGVPPGMPPVPPSPNEEGAGLMDKYKNLGSSTLMPPQ